MNLEITKITIITNGTDEVFVETDLPSPFLAEDPLRLKFEVSKDHGIEYVKKHFGINPEIINIAIVGNGIPKEEV